MTKTKDPRIVDRLAIEGATEATEALIRLGALSPEEIRELQGIRAQVGAKPLDPSEVRGFDAATLTPELAPEKIRELREREGASQAVLARYLGTAPATVSQWERGARRPDGPALKLLGLAYRHGLEYIR